MKDLKAVLDQLKAEKPREPMSEGEHKARVAVLFALFRIKDATDQTEKCKAYVDATAEIPFSLLVLAVRGLIRSHPYPDVPAVADIWKAARHLARMDREQYCGGRYLRPPTQWPPKGKSYGEVYGEFETLPRPAGAFLEAEPVRRFLLEAGDGDYDPTLTQRKSDG